MWNQCLCQYRVWRNGQLIRFLGLMGDLWQWFWPVVGEWGCSPRFKLAPKISEKTGRFSYELGKFHPFWAGRAGQNLGEFFGFRISFWVIFQICKDNTRTPKLVFYTETNRKKIPTAFLTISLLPPIQSNPWSWQEVTSNIFLQSCVDFLAIGCLAKSDGRVQAPVAKVSLDEKLSKAGWEAGIPASHWKNVWKNFLPNGMPHFLQL